MTNEFQAGKMILSQIGMFNEAVNLLVEGVEPALLGAVDECVEAFAKAEQWDGIFDLAGDDSECWLAPAQWNVGEDSDDFDPKAWFAIEAINDDNDDYWSALLCNQGSESGEAGFMFGVDEGTYGKMKAWNRSFSEIDEAAIAKLIILDFKIVEHKRKKTFFLPIHLDAAMLAETWGNDGDFSDVDPCFDPVKVALEKVKTAWPIFDAILNACPVKPLSKMPA